MSTKTKDLTNNKIDELLQIRQDGIINYCKSTEALIKMGVKIGKKENNDMTVPVSFQPYIDKYNRSNLEFEWKATYLDNTIINQFEGDSEHHFGHIDQTKLKSIDLISNFTWPTDNEEKRIIIKLNWETGLFEITNGFTPQPVKEIIHMYPLQGEKKLILKTRKRVSMSQGDINPKYKEFFPMSDEFFFYNRFILGYQVANGDKKVIIVEPSGTIGIFDN